MTVIRQYNSSTGQWEIIVAGVAGSQGNQGATGSQGYQGAQGEQGVQGSQGSQGSTGSQGNQGFQGAQGFQGSQGNQGSQGTTGTQGTQGSTGAQGSQGSSGVIASTNAQTGTTFTPALGDATTFVTLNNASAIALTIPTNASVGYAIGTQLNFIQIGAGQVTISAVTPATTTINSTGATSASPKLRTQNSAATAIKTATDTWYVVGDII